VKAGELAQILLQTPDLEVRIFRPAARLEYEHSDSDDGAEAYIEMDGIFGPETLDHPATVEAVEVMGMGVPEPIPHVSACWSAKCGHYIQTTYKEQPTKARVLVIR